MWFTSFSEGKNDPLPTEKLPINEENDQNVIQKYEMNRHYQRNGKRTKNICSDSQSNKRRKADF